MILLIEPNFLLRRSVYAYLKTYRDNIKECTTIEMAMSYFQESLPEVIVVSSHIKEHNYLELIYEINSYEDSQNIRIIVLNYSLNDLKLVTSRFSNVRILNCFAGEYDEIGTLIAGKL